MRFVIASAFALPLLAVPSRQLVAPASRLAVEQIAINDNRTPAGVLRNGVLTVRLEAREGEWHPERDTDPGIVVRAFAEEGKQLQVPGPLIRVPEGTEIHAFIRNPLSAGVMVLRGFSPRGVLPDRNVDTIQIQSGVTREVRFVAGAPGTYFYSATIGPPQPPDQPRVDAELHGAFIVDSRGAPTKPRDRVLVLGLWAKLSARTLVFADPGTPRQQNALRFTVNGKSWPHTERLSYETGDTVRFRIVNASNQVHPMHLHGFYFNVDARGNGSIDTSFNRATSPHLVVTERMEPDRTIAMTWVPDRPGNWMFHCHDNLHVLRNTALDGTPNPPEHTVHVTNHAAEMMGGLVMGIEVRGRQAPEIVSQGSPRRKLRLVARVDSGSTLTAPAYRYELQDAAASMPSQSKSLSPTIVVKRGEPVSITVVNELPEATSVHWHGIELESYFDGVAGFSGSGNRLTPAIAPRDSFEARFTPPRSGTFIYHPHADELRQQQAGLSGPLLVVDSPAAFNPANDIVLMLTAPRLAADLPRVVFVNGSTTPAPVDLRVGERYRLRFIDIHTFRPSMVTRLLRDSTLVTWRAIAKDGMDLPRDQATIRPSIQQMGNGETYDFEFTPTEPGSLSMTVMTAQGQLLATLPFRVH
jgi:FtsP/CotA-like multicopper oxidase with cupredoxin domain